MKSKSKKLPIITGMHVAKQLALFVDNKPGTLAHICKTLADADINIHAITTSDTVDHAVVRLILSDPAKALRLFEQHGTLVVKNDVLMIDTNSRIGNLAAIAHCLADNDVNIDYAYCATNPKVSKDLMVLRVSNIPKAMKVLNMAKI